MVLPSMQLSRIRTRPGASVYWREHGGCPRRGLGHGRHHCSLIMVHTCHLRIVWMCVWGWGVEQELSWELSSHASPLTGSKSPPL